MRDRGGVECDFKDYLFPSCANGSRLGQATASNIAIEVAIDQLNASKGTIAKAKAVFANMGVDGVFGKGKYNFTSD